MQINLLGLTIDTTDTDIFVNSNVTKELLCKKSDITIRLLNDGEIIEDKNTNTLFQDGIRIELFRTGALFFIEQTLILKLDLCDSIGEIAFSGKFNLSAIEEIICKKVIPIFYYKMNRGIPLHATAILTQNGAICLSGISKSGKSTLAANFLFSGLGTLITDDTLYIKQNDNDLYVYPSILPLKLRNDSQQYFSQQRKFKCNLSDPKYFTKCNMLQLKTIFFLSTCDSSDILIRTIDTKMNSSLLIENLFAADFCDFSKEFLILVMNYAQSIQFTEIVYPRNFELLDSVMKEVNDYIIKIK